MNVASIDRIRSRFPALARHEAGQPVAYFDGPGGTQVPEQVARAVADYLLHSNANTHWAYSTSVDTDLLIENAREAFADFLGCMPLEVVFGGNMTTLTFHVARAFGRSWGPGDEVVVTRLDHQANVAPWKALARDRGVTVREVPFDPRSGTLDLAAFEAALGSATRLVAIGGASNALGTVNDLDTLVSQARAAGALTFVDAVHLAPHELLDVRALGCDALACSPYKFYGPHLGVLFMRLELLANLDVPRLDCAPSEAPERLETGTLSHEGIVGAATAVDFLAWLAHPEAARAANRRDRLEATYRELHERGDELVRRLWEGLDDLEPVRLYGPPPGRHARTPTVAFTVGGHDSAAVAHHLCAGSGVYVSHGDFYASAVVEDLGLADEGLVRAGVACYTTADEVDRLVRGVAELVRR